MNKKNNEIEKTTIDETAEEIKNEENKETKVYGIVCGCDKLRLRVVYNIYDFLCGIPPSFSYIG